MSVSRLRSRSCQKTCSAAHSTPPNAPGILGPSNSSFRLGAGRFSRTNLATTRLSTFAVTLSNRPISTGKLCAAQVRQQTGARASERTRGQPARQELLSRSRGQRRGLAVWCGRHGHLTHVDAAGVCADKGDAVRAPLSRTNTGDLVGERVGERVVGEPMAGKQGVGDSASSDELERRGERTVTATLASGRYTSRLRGELSQR